MGSQTSWAPLNRHPSELQLVDLTIAVGLGGTAVIAAVGYGRKCAPNPQNTAFTGRLVLPPRPSGSGESDQDKCRGVCSVGRFAVCTGVHTSMSHRGEERGLGVSCSHRVFAVGLVGFSWAAVNQTMPRRIE